MVPSFEFIGNVLVKEDWMKWIPVLSSSLPSETTPVLSLEQEQSIAAKAANNIAILFLMDSGRFR